MTGFIDVLLRGTRWYMTQGGKPFKLFETVSRFRPGIGAIMEHLDQVEPAERAEMREWKKRKTSLVGQVLFYAAMALIPKPFGSHSPLPTT